MINCYVYFLKEHKTNTYKIGYSSSLGERLHKFDVKLPFDTSIECVWSSEFNKELETALHELFKDKNANGEWFELTNEDINNIHNFDFVKLAENNAPSEKDRYVKLFNMLVRRRKININKKTHINFALYEDNHQLLREAAHICGITKTSLATKIVSAVLEDNEIELNRIIEKIHSVKQQK